MTWSKTSCRIQSLAILACLVSSVATAKDTAKDKRPRAILLVVADDLGWNDVSFHGSEQIPTPTLDKLANNGVTLNKYYVQPVCSPTRASILTGRHVIHTGIYDPDCDPGTTLSVPYNVSMLPTHLQSLGFESHAVGKWHCGMFSDRVVPTGKGFKTFLGYYGGAEDYFTHREVGANDFHNDTGTKLNPLTTQSGVYSTHIFARRTIEILENWHAENARIAQQHELGADAAAEARDDAARSDPKHLFIYLAWQAIHSPDQVPDSYIARFKETIPDTPDGVGKHRRTVAGMVACLDEGMGNITATLDRLGVADDTLIIFSTDNGGPAQGFNGNMASNWPLRGMKRTLWEGGVRGVGFVHGDGFLSRSVRGSILDGMFHAVDWFPTVLHAAASATGLGDVAAEEWASSRLESDSTRDRGEPAWQLGDGIDGWKMISAGASPPRSEILIEAHPPAAAAATVAATAAAITGPGVGGFGTDDGNGQAIIVGDLKLILEKGPMWHGPPNDGWYDSGSNPQLYNHTIACGPKPTDPDALCGGSNSLPCLFNLTADPCEYHNLKMALPNDYKRLLARLAAYQATAVPKSHHKLPMCANPRVPIKKPTNGTWMPVCP